MDSLAQFTALWVNPKFELASSATYRQVRAIWALWRICQDLRSANRTALVVRAAPPFAIALLFLLFVIFKSNIGVISLIFTILVTILVFLTVLLFVYWLLAPPHIYEIQRQKIQEQNHCIALIKQNDTHRDNDNVNIFENQPVESEEKIRNIIRGLYAQSQQNDSNLR